MNGISFLVCIGAPAWPRIEVVHPLYRLVLGPISFWIIANDFEKLALEVIEFRK
jgi:hypothetical protein